VGEEKQVEGEAGRSIADELTNLGEQLGAALKTLWESEERQELQEEISEGVRVLGDQIEQAVKTARESEALEEAKSDVLQAVENARKSGIVQDLRQGLVDVLQSINRELGRLLSEAEEKTAEVDDQGDGVAEGAS
jgi:hypothetical protein